MAPSPAPSPAPGPSATPSALAASSPDPSWEPAHGGPSVATMRPPATTAAAASAPTTAAPAGSPVSLLSTRVASMDRSRQKQPLPSPRLARACPEPSIAPPYAVSASLPNQYRDLPPNEARNSWGHRSTHSLSRANSGLHHDHVPAPDATSPYGSPFSSRSAASTAKPPSTAVGHVPLNGAARRASTASAEPTLPRCECDGAASPATRRPATIAAAPIVASPRTLTPRASVATPAAAAVPDAPLADYFGIGKDGPVQRPTATTSTLFQQAIQSPMAASVTTASPVPETAANPAPVPAPAAVAPLPPPPATPPASAARAVVVAVTDPSRAAAPLPLPATRRGEGGSQSSVSSRDSGAAAVAAVVAPGSVGGVLPARSAHPSFSQRVARGPGPPPNPLLCQTLTQSSRLARSPSVVASISRRSFVAFSGGSALNPFVHTLQHITDNAAYIMPVSDDGGSTSEIIKAVGGPGIGDIRSRLVRLADNKSPEARAVHELLSYRLPVESVSPGMPAHRYAKSVWYDLVEGKHPLWRGISAAYRETIRAFLAHFHHEITRVSGRSHYSFDFRGGSIGNFFVSGCRLFFESLEAAIFQFLRITRAPARSSVHSIIETQSRQSYSIAALLRNGERIFGQCEISHPGISTNPTDVHSESLDGGGSHSGGGGGAPSDDLDLLADNPLEGVSNLIFDKDKAPPLPCAIRRIYYINNEAQETCPVLNPIVKDHLRHKATVIYSIGSLYTSILPCLIVPGVGSLLADPWVHEGDDAAAATTNASHHSHAARAAAAATKPTAASSHPAQAQAQRTRFAVGSECGSPHGAEPLPFSGTASGLHSVPTSSTSLSGLGAGTGASSASHRRKKVKILMLNGIADRETPDYTALDFVLAITDACNYSVQMERQRREQLAQAAQAHHHAGGGPGGAATLGTSRSFNNFLNMNTPPPAFSDLRPSLQTLHAHHPSASLHMPHGGSLLAEPHLPHSTSTPTFINGVPAPMGMAGQPVAYGQSGSGWSGSGYENGGGGPMPSPHHHHGGGGGYGPPPGMPMAMAMAHGHGGYPSSTHAFPFQPPPPPPSSLHPSQPAPPYAASNASGDGALRSPSPHSWQPDPALMGTSAGAVMLAPYPMASAIRLGLHGDGYGGYGAHGGYGAELGGTPPMAHGAGAGAGAHHASRRTTSGALAASDIAVMASESGNTYCVSPYPPSAYITHLLYHPASEIAVDVARIEALGILCVCVDGSDPDEALQRSAAGLAGSSGLAHGGGGGGGSGSTAESSASEVEWDPPSGDAAAAATGRTAGSTPAGGDGVFRAPAPQRAAPPTGLGHSADAIAGIGSDATDPVAHNALYQDLLRGGPPTPMPVGDDEPGLLGHGASSADVDTRGSEDGPDASGHATPPLPHAFASGPEGRGDGESPDGSHSALEMPFRSRSEAAGAATGPAAGAPAPHPEERGRYQEAQLRRVLHRLIQ